MKGLLKGIIAPAALAAALVGSIAGDAAAGTSGGVYNMDAMLSAPHPFARPYRPAAPAATPATQPPVKAAPRTAPTAAPAPAPKVVQATEDRPVAKPAPRSRARQGWHGLSEIRVGALYNDFGPFSHQKEEGVLANLELLFVSPDFLDIIWSPRPHIGTSLNTAGDTSVPFYAGLSWEWDFLDDWMWGFSLGGAYHNGYTKLGTAPTDQTPPYAQRRKELGCSVLFRESLKLGYRFNEHHSLMAHFDHISNAKLCETNEGLESLGIQYGYRF